MAEEDFIDIMKVTQLPVEEVAYLKDNPEGLTKEGIEFSLEMWKKSKNKYQIKKFADMAKMCTNIVPSGKTPDGLVILAKLDGKINWTKEE